MDAAARTHLTVGDSALVLIDVQERLVPAIFEHERTVRACRRILRVAQLLGVPIVATEQNPRGLGPTVASLKEVLGGTEPIAKMEFSCFGSPAFVDVVLELNRPNLLLCGIESHICVYQTAIDALRAGYNVSVLVDAVSARTALAAQVGVERLWFAGAVPAHTEMAMYEWLGVAGTTAFRSALQIIKEEADPSS